VPCIQYATCFGTTGPSSGFVSVNSNKTVTCNEFVYFYMKPDDGPSGSGMWGQGVDRSGSGKGTGGGLL
jgi:hypothetical protein